MTTIKITIKEVKEKIKVLEALSETLWEQLGEVEDSYFKAQEKGLEAEERIFKEQMEKARTRWAMTNRIVEFLKGERKEEDL